MKRNKGIGLLVVFLVIGLLATGLMFGITTYNENGTQNKIMNSVSDIRLGIDIRGGVDAVFEPEDPTLNITDDDLNNARTIMEIRLDKNNIADREVTVDYARKRIIVRFPWKADETNFNPQEAIAELGQMGVLTFRDVDGNILMEGTDVASAYYESRNGAPIVLLNFKQQGIEKFALATAAVSARGEGENYMPILMDDAMVSAPRCEKVITDSSCIIEGIGSVEEAKSLANTISAGALPFKLVSKSNSSISPTLGQSALDMMLLAGIIAFGLISLFMIIIYRVPGFLAVIALAGQMVGQLLVLATTQYTLTLPGIAGIILAIGMGVDANVITIERIKEELRAGKSLRASIDAGYKKAFSAIFDGNVTVAIAAILLWILGTGSMISFGITLFSGVVFNIICGVLLSRIMNKSISGLVRNKALYGYKNKGGEENV